MKLLSAVIFVFFSLGITAQPTLKDLTIKNSLSFPDGFGSGEIKGNHSNRSEPFRLDSFNIFLWDGASENWDLSSRNLYSYNAADLPEEIVEYLVQGQVSNYNALDSFYYDTEGSEVYNPTYSWNGSGWEEYTRLYTTLGQDSKVVIREAFNGVEWINYYKVESAYDANGLLLTQLNYAGDGTNWKLESRSTYSYNAQNLNETLFIEVYDNNIWVNVQRFRYMYDAEGRLISAHSERYISGQWENQFLSTFTYDNEQRTAIYQIWLFNQWENDYRIVKQFDETRLTYVTYSLWTGLEWMNRDSIHYYYIDLTSLYNQEQDNYAVSLYPNPVQHTLILETKDEFSTNGSVAIFTVTGLKVRSDILCSTNKCEIEVSDLKPGIYFAAINNGQHQQRFKFLKL